MLALDWLLSHKVEVFLNRDTGTNFREEEGFDYVVHCEGYTYRTEFMHINFKDCILNETGQIFVNDHMQLTNKNPLLTA